LESNLVSASQEQELAKNKDTVSSLTSVHRNVRGRSRRKISVDTLNSSSENHKVNEHSDGYVDSDKSGRSGKQTEDIDSNHNSNSNKTNRNRNRNRSINGNSNGKDFYDEEYDIGNESCYDNDVENDASPPKHSLSKVYQLIEKEPLITKRATNIPDRFLSDLSTEESSLEGPSKRGVLVAFEGIDRSGKSTQAKLLVDFLNLGEIHTELLHFPERTTMIGKQLDNYLRNATEIKDRKLHHLFSRNRWEFYQTICRHLIAGRNVVVDRYAHSGLAYSLAKGLALDWCLKHDCGLPAPDVVFFLDLAPDVASRRRDFGRERYEKEDFQTKVRTAFLQLRTSNWICLNACEAQSSLQFKIQQEFTRVLLCASQKRLNLLWWPPLFLAESPSSPSRRRSSEDSVSSHSKRRKTLPE